jgi:hypothetical protein
MSYDDSVDNFLAWLYDALHDGPSDPEQLRADLAAAGIDVDQTIQRCRDLIDKRRAVVDEIVQEGRTE